MSMGSSIGNFGRQEAAEFLKGFASILGPEDFMMVGVDGCLDKIKVFAAYNDREGKTHDFYGNALMQANKLLGKAAFKQDDWQIVGEYNTGAGRHEAFFVPIRDIKVDGVFFSAGERVRIEDAHKYSSVQCQQLWAAAGLREGAVYGDRTGQYSMCRISYSSIELSQCLLGRSILDLLLRILNFIGVLAKNPSLVLQSGSETIPSVTILHATSSYLKQAVLRVLHDTCYE